MHAYIHENIMFIYLMTFSHIYSIKQDTEYKEVPHAAISQCNYDFNSSLFTARFHRKLS